MINEIEESGYRYRETPNLLCPLLSPVTRNLETRQTRQTRQSLLTWHLTLRVGAPAAYQLNNLLSPSRQRAPSTHPLQAAQYPAGTRPALPHRHSPPCDSTSPPFQSHPSASFDVFPLSPPNLPIHQTAPRIQHPVYSTISIINLLASSYLFPTAHRPLKNPASLNSYSSSKGSNSFH